MRRILLLAFAASALLLSAPAVASAHHARHHSRHARHAHHKARIMRFGSLPSSTTGSAPTSPTPPSGETAGKVKEFTGGVLTIVLSDEKTLVSGKVTEHTEINCESATANQSGDDNEQGDNSGAGDSSSGPVAHSSDHTTGTGGDDNGGGEDEHGAQSPCTTEALKPGAVVREAELSVGSGGAVWDQIDLIQ